MRLKSITINGFQGIPFDKESELKVDNFGHRNIFIGPNNSGKSIVFRFLNLLKQMTVEDFHAERDISKDIVDETAWWKQEINKAIFADITFDVDQEFSEKIKRSYPQKHGGLVAVGASLILNDTFKIGIRLRKNAGFNANLKIVPHVAVANEWKPINSIVNPGLPELYLTREGKYSNTKDPDHENLSHRSVSTLKDWFGHARFFDAVRALDRGGGRLGMDDGSMFLTGLCKWKRTQEHTGAFRRFEIGYIDKLNELFRNCGMPQVVAFDFVGDDSRPKMHFIFDNAKEVPIPLESMGSGIAQVVLLLASLIMDGPRNMEYFLEEPETHLHPRLLRRTMQLLAKTQNVRFYITSHSNVVLDSLSEMDRVFSFSQTKEKGCKAYQTSDLTGLHEILDSLGVSGSSLLQVNCVIWVEGPTDRIYIRKWLELHAENIGDTFVEGSDYGFAFYGGRILNHFTLEAENLNDLLQMIKICRNSAVVMDKDLANEVSENEIDQEKKRILDEAIGKQNRFAAVTEGRTIENDLPTEVLKKATASLLKVDVNILTGLSLTGNSRYFDEIKAYLNDLGNDCYKTKVSNKVIFARAVTEVWGREGKDGVPMYIRKIANLIRDSRVL